MTSSTRTKRPHVAGQTQTGIAAHLLVEYLERLGVEVIFGLCGHTIIALLDALRTSSIRFITTRHEQVAAHAADGYSRVSGKVGVLLTHLGPGLTNAVTGVANAALDSVPMVVIAGDIPSHYFGRHAHQEVLLHQDADQFRIYEPFCKRIYRVDRPADLPRAIERAFHLSQTGRPGPVLVDVPMDIFSADLPVDAFDKVPAEICRPAVDDGTAGRIVDALAAAERPVLNVGGGVVATRAFDELASLAEALEVPIAHTPDGHRLHPLGSSLAAWYDRLLGHANRQQDLPGRRPDRGDRNAPGRGELELVVPGHHLHDSADPSDPH
jgi:acetolactate synthase-1/2/3 large subunit